MFEKRQGLKDQENVKWNKCESERLKRQRMWNNLIISGIKINTSKEKLFNQNVLTSSFLQQKFKQNKENYNHYKITWVENYSMVKWNK